MVVLEALNKRLEASNVFAIFRCQRAFKTFLRHKMLMTLENILRQSRTSNKVSTSSSPDAHPRVKLNFYVKFLSRNEEDGKFQESHSSSIIKSS